MKAGCIHIENNVRRAAILVTVLLFMLLCSQVAAGRSMVFAGDGTAAGDGATVGDLIEEGSEAQSAAGAAATTDAIQGDDEVQSAPGAVAVTADAIQENGEARSAAAAAADADNARAGQDKKKIRMSATAPGAAYSVNVPEIETETGNSSNSINRTDATLDEITKSLTSSESALQTAIDEIAAWALTTDESESPIDIIALMNPEAYFHDAMGWAKDASDQFEETLKASIEEARRLKEEAERQAREEEKRQKALGRDIIAAWAVMSQVTEETPWVIYVNKGTCTVTICRELQARVPEAAPEEVQTVYIPVHASPCSIGAPEEGGTPDGTYYIQDHLRWHELYGPRWGQWCSHFLPSYLFHSLPYMNPQDPNSLEEDSYNKLGQAASHGCVRLAAIDAKYICDNVPIGSRVEIFEGTAADDPLGTPERPYVGKWTKGYDPTDPEYQPQTE